MSRRKSAFGANALVASALVAAALVAAALRMAAAQTESYSPADCVAGDCYQECLTAQLTNPNYCNGQPYCALFTSPSPQYSLKWCQFDPAAGTPCVMSPNTTVLACNGTG